MLQFFIGLDHPATAWPFLRSMISINTIRDRKGPFRANDWMMDSGGFTELSTHGRLEGPALNNMPTKSIAGRTMAISSPLSPRTSCANLSFYTRPVSLSKITRKSPSLATLAYSISQTFTSCPFSRAIRQNLTPPTLISTGNSSHPVNGLVLAVSANAMVILTRSKTSS